MARRFSIPFVITPLVHEGIWGDGALFFRIYRQADAVIALLDVERQVYLSGGVRPDHVHTVGVSPVIAPDYDAMLFRDKYNLRGAVALFVGRQIQSKGYQSLLEAAPIVWRRHPDTHFVFIGPLEKSSTPMTASPDPRVINLGPVSDEEKTSAMAACDVFCLPSNSEIMPTAILEAWFFGKPVIGGDIPTLRELIQGSGGGLNVSQTPEAIASGLSALLDNPDRAAQMGESGRQRVRRNYSIGAVCNQLETIYQTLCGRTL
jgi:glycosyltransferase involved in cell wall biosynthesis